jgi:hypothetical protein
MSDVQLTLLAERIAKLERQNRSLKRFGVALAGGAALVGALGAKLADDRKVLEAHELRLVDDHGRTRVSWVVNGDGAVLSVTGADADSHVHLGVNKAGTALVLQAEGGGRLGMLVPPKRAPVLDMRKDGLEDVTLSPALTRPKGAEEPASPK